MADDQAPPPAAVRSQYASGLDETLEFRLVTVTTEQRRDHEIPIRYCDANEWHDLVDVAGPDRVSGGAWSAPYAREYFRCVREDGMMVWLYKGSFESADWFLHGWWD